jgi:hypothetical protein
MATQQTTVLLVSSTGVKARFHRSRTEKTNKGSAGKQGNQAKVPSYSDGGLQIKVLLWQRSTPCQALAN